MTLSSEIIENICCDQKINFMKNHINNGQNIHVCSRGDPDRRFSASLNSLFRQNISTIQKASQAQLVEIAD